MPAPPLPSVPAEDETTVAIRTGFRAAYAAMLHDLVVPRLRVRLESALVAQATGENTGVPDQFLTDDEWEFYISEFVEDDVGDASFDGIVAAGIAFGVLASDNATRAAQAEQIDGLLSLSGLIRESLEQWYTDIMPSGTGDVMERLDESPLGESRADIAARITQQSATNAGTHVAIEQLGHVDSTDLLTDDGQMKVAAMQWITQRDNRVRDAHAAIDTDVVPVGTPFTMTDETGSYEARYPGDPTLPLRLRINCRCVLGYVEGSRVRRTLGASYDELRAKARDLGIGGRSRMSKSQLQNAIIRQLCLHGLAGGTDCPDLLSSMNRNSLLGLAREEGITGRYRMSRTQLIEALTAQITPAARTSLGYAPRDTWEQVRRRATARRRLATVGPEPSPIPRGVRRRTLAAGVFSEYGGISRGYVPCVHCGLKLAATTDTGLAVLVPEPIIPWTQGGPVSSRNAVPSCSSCFSARGQSMTASAFDEFVSHAVAQ